jgi:segregation and condensation protein B
MDTATRQGLEAVLFLAEEPVGADDLAEVLEVEVEAVESELEQLAEHYAEQQRGIEIRRAAGGWRMYTAAGARPVLERWALAGRSGRLTQAALETLAVIAYKQPISRQEVGDIRGVNADGAVRSLVARGLVEEVGRDEGPGQALLYGTTTLFLERIGIDDLEELPPLTDFLPEAPAPDEPELGAIREARRRIAEASAQGSGPEPQVEGDEVEDEDDSLPAPTPHVAQRGDIDELTDRLDEAARSAVGRLRQAVSAAERDEADRFEGADDADAAEATEDTEDTDAAGDADEAQATGETERVEEAEQAPEESQGARSGDG